MENSKRIRLQLTGIQNREGEEDRTKVVADGEYTSKDGKHYIIFEEIDEGIVTKSMIKLTEDSFEITKKGGIVSRMKFIDGENDVFSYTTTYGSMFMETKTKELSIDIKSDVIKVDIAYDLISNDLHIAACQINLSVDFI